MRHAHPGLPVVPPLPAAVALPPSGFEPGLLVALLPLEPPLPLLAPLLALDPPLPLLAPLPALVPPLPLLASLLALVPPSPLLAPLLPLLPLDPPLPLLAPMLPPSAHPDAPMSGPVLSRPKKPMTAFASIGVVWPPFCCVQASRTEKPHELSQTCLVKPVCGVSVVVGVAFKPRTLVHSLIASPILL
jgi:hypothetical protein